jgi:hypothetical protein
MGITVLENKQKKTNVMTYSWQKQPYNEIINIALKNWAPVEIALFQTMLRNH